MLFVSYEFGENTNTTNYVSVNKTYLPNSNARVGGTEIDTDGFASYCYGEIEREIRAKVV